MRCSMLALSLVVDTVAVGSRHRLLLRDSALGLRWQVTSVLMTRKQSERNSKLPAWTAVLFFPFPAHVGPLYFQLMNIRVKSHPCTDLPRRSLAKRLEFPRLK